MIDPLLKQLQAALQNVDQVPKGWLPRSAWEKKWGLSTGETNKYLKAGVEKKLLQQRKFKIATESGVVRTIPHYAPACQKG